MSAKIRSAGKLSPNPQETVIATNIRLEITKIQDNYRSAKCILAHPTKILGGPTLQRPHEIHVLVLLP